MSPFGQSPKKTDKSAPVAVERTPSWQDGVAAATPQRARYYDTLRTNAFINDKMGPSYLEFWAALQIDAKNDQWRVMHYKLFDLELDDGRFEAEVVTQKDVSFIEAVAQLSRLEYLAAKLIMHSATEMEKDYPPTKFPELRTHYFDITHFRHAANVEGIAFDEHHDPYRRLQGKIFSDATFRRSEVAQSILAADQARDAAAINKMEAGLLADIFTTSSTRPATLDGILRMGECLNIMDEFATDIAAFYCSVQLMLNIKPDLTGIDGLDAETLKAVTRSVNFKYRKSYEAIKDDLLPTAAERLDEAEKKGVHVEPFRKFLAECEVYVHMLNSSIKLPMLEKSLMSASQADTNLLTEIQRSMALAQQKFLSLGGSEEKMDQIKAWIANPAKDDVPGWLPGFLTRYYTSRSKVMAKVQARTAQQRDVALMSTEVKPPLTDDLAEIKAREKKTAAPKKA